MLFTACLTAAAAAQAPDSLRAVRRVVAATTLAAKEYALGVTPRGGRVTVPAEVEEAKLFVDQARLEVPLLPATVRAFADSELGAVRRLLDQLAPPDAVGRRTTALVQRIAAAAGDGGALEPSPGRPPSLARGAAVYAEQCAACHGAAGRGDGPKARQLEGPPPTDLTDPAVMRPASWADIYHKILIGVAGTAMPEFEEALSEEDRWAVTAYVATLQYGGSVAAATFAAVRRELDSAVALRSAELAFDAYLTFEGVETEVRARNAPLAGEIEGAFAELRTRAAAGVEGAELAAIHQRLLGALERAERLVADRSSTASLFLQSAVLLLREGFEAILIIAALMAFLARAGAPERRRDVARGAWGAVAASLVTWVLVELLFHITPGQREALEGLTMLLATGVLFYVSYWLLSKIEAAKWHAFVKGKMERALSTGSGLALASVAFLAVYREGFETILFYKALLTSAGTGGVPAVVSGMAVGGVALVLVYLGINYFGLKVPLRPFFAVTSAMLYYMAFVFAGKGIADLQEAGLVKTSVVEWAPRVPALGVYPTAQSLALQGLLLVLLLFALLWTQRRPSTVGLRADG